MLADALLSFFAGTVIASLAVAHPKVLLLKSAGMLGVGERIGSSSTLSASKRAAAWLHPTI